MVKNGEDAQRICHVPGTKEGMGVQQKEAKGKDKNYFFHSRVLRSTGIPRTLHNTLKESAYTCFSKTPTSVLHGCLRKGMFRVSEKV